MAPRPDAVLARWRFPGEARPHLLAASGTVDDLRRRRDLRAVRAGPVPRLPGRGRLAADPDPPRRATWRAGRRLTPRLGEIRWSEGASRSTSEPVRARARGAIVAVPPNLTNSIVFDPVLPAWRMRMSQALSQGSINKVLAVYEPPFWRDEGLSGQGFAPYELVRELYDNSPPSASAGVLTTFLAGENAERAGRMSAADRRAEVLERHGEVRRRAGHASRSTTSRPTGPVRSGPGAPTARASAPAVSPASARTSVARSAPSTGPAPISRDRAHPHGGRDSLGPPRGRGVPAAELALSRPA